MKKKNGENACFISISASQKSYVRNRTTSRAQPHYITCATAQKTCARGFEPPTFWSVAKRSIQLS